MVEIRNPTVEILEQGESDNKDILEEEGIKSLEMWTSTTETGAGNCSERGIRLGDLSDWKAEPFHSRRRISLQGNQS